MTRIITEGFEQADLLGLKHAEMFDGISAQEPTNLIWGPTNSLGVMDDIQPRTGRGMWWSSVNQILRHDFVSGAHPSEVFVGFALYTKVTHSSYDILKLNTLKMCQQQKLI